MVKINIEDKLVHTSLAYLLDRLGVYERMLEIRKCWKLETLVSPENFEEWIISPHPNISFTSEAVDYYQEGSDRYDLENSRSNNFDRDLWDKTIKFAGFDQIQFEVELLMKDFGINLRYKKIILKAIVCDQIDKQDLEFETGDFNYDFLLDSQKLRFVVEKSYHSKSKVDIKKDRGMYYQNKYDHISQIRLGKELHASRDTVAHALRRYRKFLSS